VELAWQIFVPRPHAGDGDMNAIVSLGSFERVLLRDAWPTEYANFTPWLAQPSNMELLGEALKMELEVEGVEWSVGSFKADIIARVVDESEDHRVVIENQFGGTDHKHLGQILTYLAGMENAKTVVWIAETIQQDHRAAIDWLNANTAAEFSFFAIEVELWRIGDSPPAPRFNLIVSPNDWVRSIGSIGGEKEHSAAHQLRLRYWASFAEYIRRKMPTPQIKQAKRGVGYPFINIGKSGYRIQGNLSTQKQRIGVKLVIPDKSIFRALYAQRDAIEREIDGPLDWQCNSDGKKTRILLYKGGVNPANEAQWPEQHVWMLENLERFRATFVPRLKSLPLASSTEAEDDDEASED
jgi:hypothetical protein